MPKNRNAQGFNEKPKSRDLWSENQVLRTRLDNLERTLARMENMLRGQNVHNLGKARQEPSNGDRGLRYKPKAKEDVTSFHRVPYSYGTNPMLDRRRSIEGGEYRKTFVDKRVKRSGKIKTMQC